MKIIKNITECSGLPRIGGIYLALREPFSVGLVFTISRIDRDLCWIHGGEHQFRCPFRVGEEQEKRCLGMIQYQYNGEYVQNFKCVANVIKRFRPATKTEIMEF